MDAFGSEPRLFLPELALLAAAVLTMLLDIALARIGTATRRAAAVTATSAAGLATAAFLLGLTLQAPAAEIFSRCLRVDPLSQFFKGLLLLSGFAAVVMCWISREIEPEEKAEMQALMLLGTLGMCLLVSAIHFLVIFLAYEMTGVACAVMAAFRRRSARSIEAGLKLFVHGALTAVLFAFGVVLLHGAAGSFNVIDLRASLAATPPPAAYLWLAFGLIFVAVAVRLGAFPFHLLMPDVVEGAPSPVSAFFSVSAGMATLALGLRLCLHVFSAKTGTQWEPLPGVAWPGLVMGVAAVTMTVANLTALFQTNVKRMIGYSCMAQLACALMGVGMASQMGVAAALFSLAVFGVVALGAYFVIQMVTDEAGDRSSKSLEGLAWRRPFEAVAICVFFLSLAGLPPLAGFIGRFYLLGVVVKEKYYWLACVAAANWVIGLAYFVSLIHRIFAVSSLEGTPRGQRAHNATARLAIAALLAPVVVLGVYWEPFMNYIARFLGETQW